MLIGGDFNKKSNQLLKELFVLSNGNIEEKVTVMSLNEILGFERNEVKNLLEYLENKELIKIESIGGPLLYGDISITERGICKVKK